MKRFLHLLKIFVAFFFVLVGMSVTRTSPPRSWLPNCRERTHCSWIDNVLGRVAEKLTTRHFRHHPNLR